MIGTAIGEALPLALGIALSPTPIIAVILMLLGPTARRTAPGFLLGWVLGVFIITGLCALLAGFLPPHSDAGGTNILRALVQFTLAALFLWLALRQWRGRPGPDEDAELPRWMAALDHFGALKACGLGLALSALNPKNLVIAASAGFVIGGAGLPAADAGLVTGIFVLCAAVTVAVPVVGYLCASDQLRAPLESTRVWLVRENHTVMTVLLAFLAILMLGKGIGSL